MIVFPNAKINIGLNILNRRLDGYHNLETIFFPVGIKDALEVVEADQMSFASSGLHIPGNAWDNLCLKAYHLLAKDHNLPPVSIHLHKNIPIGAGLGGGSSDASFFIRLLNDKFDLELDAAGMEHYASMLGSDCSFFIRNAPVFAYERGDKFEPVSVDLSTYFLVLVMPETHVSTAQAYQEVRFEGSPERLTEAIQCPVSDWKYLIRNSFEETVFTKYPEIGMIKEKLYEAGAIYASMSGSGSAVYGIFPAEIKLPELEVKNRVFYGA